MGRRENKGRGVNEEMNTIQNKKLLDFASLVTQLLIEAGSEVFRVEDTVGRILSQSNMSVGEVYVTRTGFTLTLDDPDHEPMTLVKRVAPGDTNLAHIDQVNDISRDFCNGSLPLDKAYRKLKAIKANYYRGIVRSLGEIGIGFAFAQLLGGTFSDMIASSIAAVAMVLAHYFAVYIGANSYMDTLMRAMAIYIIAIFLHFTPFLIINTDIVIVATFMPMLPGAAFTTAIRDTLEGNYLAGTIKMIEAIVKSSAIVMGVGFGMLMLGVG